MEVEEGMPEDDEEPCMTLAKDIVGPRVEVCVCCAWKKGGAVEGAVGCGYLEKRDRWKTWRRKVKRGERLGGVEEWRSAGVKNRKIKSREGRGDPVQRGGSCRQPFIFGGRRRSGDNQAKR